MAVKPIIDNWTLVVVGDWNTRIFTPDWVGAKLFEADDLTTEVSLTPGQSMVRFTHAGVRIIPQDDRLVIGVQDIASDTLSRAEEVGVRLLSLLPHTPVTAYGVNFGFLEARPRTALTAVFRASDHKRISEMYEIGRIELTRTLGLDEGVLNLKHVFDDPTVELHFNFHHQSPEAGLAAEGLRGRVQEYRAVAYRILEEAYALRVNEEGKDE